MGIVRYNKDTAFGALGGTAITEMQLCGINSSGVAVLADGDAIVKAVGACVFTRKTTDPTVTLSDDCEIEVPGGTFTPGGLVYLSNTPGGLTQTATTTNGQLRQVVGHAISATRVRLRINPAQFIYQTAGNSTVAFG